MSPRAPPPPPKKKAKVVQGQVSPGLCHKYTTTVIIHVAVLQECVSSNVLLISRFVYLRVRKSIYTLPRAVRGARQEKRKDKLPWVICL